MNNFIRPIVTPLFSTVHVLINGTNKSSAMYIGHVYLKLLIASGSWSLNSSIHSPVTIKFISSDKSQVPGEKNPGG